MNNKYYKHSRITERKFRLIVKNFAKDVNASNTAEEIGLTRKSVNTIFLKIRRRMYEYTRKTPPLHLGRFKTPDCSFLVGSDISSSSLRMKDESIVFCAFFGNRTIQTDIIYASDPTVFRKLEIAIQNTRDCNIQDFGFSDSRFNEISSLYYGFPAFHLYYEKSVKQFRDFAKPRLKKLRGIKEDKLILHLKECEWRFNNSEEFLYQFLLELLRKNPI